MLVRGRGPSLSCPSAPGNFEECLLLGLKYMPETSVGSFGSPGFYSFFVSFRFARAAFRPCLRMELQRLSRICASGSW